ncbi:5-oxoprolinase/urea amidolyase family protein [Leucobacter sp. CSA1]|uniref:5-oxoprolinase/urea amidolyase family protein n=1 Tax=Leucobacter chromiisoli TaxID=2796471 RepID=A0A934Q925_9MICO|nr:urea amidolyase family protein [Leucobacter chromiisoli]MBK0420116.1 5-oxoprolinase/urea amidolyase family protein [Leucobacter chromiisoli]
MTGAGPAASRGALRTPRLRASGDESVLLDCGSLEGALGVLEALDSARAAGALDVVELVPAAETVLVRGGEARDPRVFAARLSGLLAGAGGGAGRAAEAPGTVIPVRYDGADLAEVAELTGMSVDQVIERHTAAEYTVAFTGFAPGFAYLSGGDPALAVPRRPSPRPRIPAGAVAIAGRFSGVYPRPSPGGWQLLGRTDYPMWDLGREQPAALIPGGRVRFAATREEARAADPRATGARSVGDPGPARPDDGASGASEPRSESAPGLASPPALIVRDPGLQTLVQDAGRPGLAELGVSASGAADRGALVRANRLVGNAPGAAVLELGHGAFAAEAATVSVIALAGAPRAGRIAGPFGVRSVAADRAFRIDPGERLELGPPERGLRTVLAIRGGVLAPLTLGSASRDTLAGLGPDPLAEGAEVRAAEGAASAVVGAVGEPEPQGEPLPAPGETSVLEVVPGPRDDWFDEAGMTRLWENEWRVSPRSDRVGLRLEGSPLTRAEGFRELELPSEGLVTGSIQVPPDGQPVLFLADRPLTGGYPVVGVVRERDLDLAAQLPPGALVRFRRADRAPAAEARSAADRAPADPPEAPARPTPEETRP